jgi:PAT family beta-lactamase induction signal transducer AmpG
VARRARNHEGTNFWTFATAVSIDSFAYAFASIVLITYMSSLTTTQLAGSQFALLTSICALPGSLVAGVSGYFVQWLDFERFFIATSLIGGPST